MYNEKKKFFYEKGLIHLAIEEVRAHLKKWNRESDILEFEVSTATVIEAAQAVGVEPARIAKTLSFRSDSGGMVVVTAGDAKTDNTKFKKEFGFKPRMLTPQEALSFTGHAIGGVCPFALNPEVTVYLDLSLKRFETVFPACGSSHSAIELTCEELEIYASSKKWIDVCTGWY